MSEDVVKTTPDMNLSAASKMMTTYKVDYLLVEKDGEIAGIFTTSDMKKCVSDNCNAFETTVEDVMTKEVIAIKDDADITEAIEIMKKHEVKRLPVVENKVIIGIITATDIGLAAPNMLKEIADIITGGEDSDSGFAQ